MSGAKPFYFSLQANFTIRTHTGSRAPVGALRGRQQIYRPGLPLTDSTATRANCARQSLLGVLLPRRRRRLLAPSSEPVLAARKYTQFTECSVHHQHLSAGIRIYITANKLTKHITYY